MGRIPPLLLVATCAATGLIGALLGLGGGVFLVPLLTLALGVPIRVAIAASLISVIATASASSTINLERGLVNMRLGMASRWRRPSAGWPLRVSPPTAAPPLPPRATLALMGVVMAALGRRNVIADDVGRTPGRTTAGGPDTTVPRDAPARAGRFPRRRAISGCSASAAASSRCRCWRLLRIPAASPRRRRVHDRRDGPPRPSSTSGAGTSPPRPPPSPRRPPQLLGARLSHRSRRSLKLLMAMCSRGGPAWRWKAL